MLTFAKRPLRLETFLMAAVLSLLIAVGSARAQQAASDKGSGGAASSGSGSAGKEDNAKRQAPRLLLPEEWSVAVTRVPVRSIIFDKTMDHVVVVSRGTLKLVEIGKLDTMTDARLAEHPWPPQMAIVVGAFPLRKQYEEFAQ